MGGSSDCPEYDTTLVATEDISVYSHTRLQHRVDRGGVRLGQYFLVDLEAELHAEVYRRMTNLRAKNGFRPPTGEARE